MTDNKLILATLPKTVQQQVERDIEIIIQAASNPNITSVQALLTHTADPLFSVYADDTQAGQVWGSIILKQAQMQIDAETDNDSPWTLKKRDTEKQKRTKEVKYKAQIAQRAYTIAHRMQEQTGSASTMILLEIEKSSYTYFTEYADASLQQFAVYALEKDSSQTAARKEVSFVHITTRAVADGFVEEQTVLELTSHGSTRLGDAAAAMRKLYKNEEANTETVGQVFTDAMSLSRRDFNNRHNKAAVDIDMPYEIHRGDHTSIVALQVDNVYVGLILARIEDIAIESQQPIIARAAARDFRSLVLSGDKTKLLYAVLNKIERLVFCVIEARACDQEYIVSVLTQYKASDIKKAIKSLYADDLIEQTKIGTKIIWNIKEKSNGCD